MTTPIDLDPIRRDELKHRASALKLHGLIAHWDEVRRAVYDVVVELNGSISAEHGIGQLNLEANLRSKSEVEIDLMRSIKRALDPENLMNPGRVVPE